MSLFSFLRTPSHQRFKYHPRHYNPQKEELMERVNAAQAMGTDEDDIDKIKTRIKGKMTRGGASDYSQLISYRRKYKKQSNMRIFVMVLILLGIVYLVYYFN